MQIHDLSDAVDVPAVGQLPFLNPPYLLLDPLKRHDVVLMAEPSSSRAAERRGSR
jgi:hypothetical protein